MIHRLINLTLLLFSYETKFLTSCYFKNNICQIWTFLTEGKYNVFRGQNSLSSGWGSAGVIYGDAGGTVGHKLCEKSMALPAEKDELKYITTRGSTESLIKDIGNGLTEGRGNWPCQPRCSWFPINWKGMKYTLQTAWVCISDHPELWICHILLGIDYGFKTKQTTK